LIDGTVFDSSVQRNQPFKTGVGQVIKAWQEALQLMTPGTKLRIVCPPDIAYGERGAGQMIGPNSVLVFEMELISIDVP
jgi:FKBP-type peptidyl-prolyl cis-trans isomerase FklB